MITKPLTSLAALVFLATFTGVVPATWAAPPAGCDCGALVLPSAPSNSIDFTISWAYPPDVSPSFMTATVLGSGAMPPGVYESWCADAQTDLLPGTEGYEYLGRVYSSADTNLNQYLALETDNTNVLVGPAAWNDVNYLLNHRTGYNYWDVQGAIWHFIGGPAVATPPYPYFNAAAVSQLVSDTISNAATWTPQFGDVVAAVVAITWAVDNQIVIIELPCPNGTIPALAVSVNCPTECGPVDFAGSVSNEGNVTLTNVNVFSSQPSENMLVLGPISLAPGAVAAFTGSYIVPCVTNLTTNAVPIVTTNTIGVVTTNTISVVTTNMVPVVTTNTVGVVTTNTVGVVTTNTVPVVTTNTVAVVTTNTVAVVTTNTVPVVTTNMVAVVTTNTVPVVTTNTISVVTTNMVPVVTTNTVAVVTTNTFGVVTTNTIAVVTTNTVAVVTTDTVPVITTNIVTVISTNTIATVTTNVVTPTFGTIDPVSSVLTDRFSVPPNLHGLMYADQDENWGPTLFYSVREPASGADEFDTISTIAPSVGVVTDRFALSSSNYDALTLAAPDVGYGAVNFYYVRHDNSGLSTFGEIIAQGASSSADLWPLANSGYNGLAFAAANLGYNANMFYSLREDKSGLATFGTINPTPGGIEADLYGVGTNFDSLVYVSGAVSTWGTSIFAYLRHDNTGSTIGTIDPVTHVVTDRINLGTNLLSALTFTATAVGYGPNLFYYLRPGGSTLTTNTVTSLSTNDVESYTTNDVTSFITNFVTSLTTNLVTSFTTNNVTSFSTNNVTSYTTNSVTSFTTNTVISFSTNNVVSFSTNNVTSFTTNSVTSFTTNSVTSFTTNSVTSFSTNNVTSFTTNNVTSFTTNNATLTYNSSASQLLGGVLSGNGTLIQMGPGTLTLSNVNTFSGATLIKAGTFALTGVGSLANSSVSVSSGGTLDVSGLTSTAYVMGGSSFSASGDAPATIKGASGGTVSLGSLPITLTWNGSAPSLTISQGTLVLNGNVLTLNSFNGLPLPVGTYSFISGPVSGTIASAVTGTAIGAGTTGALSISGGSLMLTVLNTTGTALSGATPTTYGNPLSITATVTPTPPDGESVVFYANAAPLLTNTTVGGVATLSVSNLPVATYSMTATYLGDSTNSPSTSLPFSQTVGPATLTYVATPASQAFSSANTAFAGTVTGFVNGDTQSGATTGLLAFTSATTATSPVGSYPITGSGLSAVNYIFVQASANATALTITGGTVTVLSGLTANDKVYDASAAASLSITNTIVLAGLSGADAATVTLSTNGYTAAFATTNATTNIAVTVLGLTLTGGDYTNYTLTQPVFAATITQAPVSVASGLTVNPADYGTLSGLDAASLTSNNVTLSGVLSQDLANVALDTNGYTAAFTATNANPAVPVTVTGMSLTGSEATNYTLLEPSLTGAINQATLTYAATPASQIYGSANTTFSGDVTGFVYSDTQSSATTGALTFTSATTPTTPAGSYAINGSGLSASNYTFVQAAANATALTITGRGVSVPGTITIVNAGNGTIIITSAGTPTGVYMLQVSSDLTSAGNWTTITTNIAGAGGAFSVTNAAAGAAQYYRTVSPP